MAMNTHIVVNKTIIVNGRKYESVEELPPEMRRLVENALRGQGVTADAPSGVGVQMTVESGKPRFRTFINVSGSESHGTPQPIEPPSGSPEARRFVWDLAFWVALGLLFWFWLGR